MNTPIPR